MDSGDQDLGDPGRGGWFVVGLNRGPVGEALAYTGISSVVNVITEALTERPGLAGYPPIESTGPRCR